jgi:predicted SnoaL-like aldol condensation-catalyzing enzyme
LTKLIIGHFHDDCLGGLEYLQSIGVESIANYMTIDKCKKIGIPIPSTPFSDSLTFDFNGEQIDCRFFGAGHSFDNITVWIPSKKILFGGCLIKARNSRGLGNLSDAVVEEWDLTIKNLLDEYSDIKTVIPGHGDIGGKELLFHTLELVKKTNKMNEKLKQNKENAVAFYKMSYEGNPLKATDLYVGTEYIQHNPDVADGKQGFIDYFEKMQVEYPNKSIEFVRVIAEDELVALHTHQIWPDKDEYVTMDFFRFDNNGKIVEHWDSLQQIPKTSANKNTMY